MYTVPLTCFFWKNCVLLFYNGVLATTSRKSKQIPQPQRQKNMLPHLFQADRVWLHCRYLTSDMAQGFFGRSWEGSEAGRFQITCSKPSIWIAIPLSISVTDKRNEFTNLTVRCIRGCIIKSSIQVGWLEVATSYVTRSTRLHGMIIHPGKINLLHFSAVFSPSNASWCPAIFFHRSPSWYPEPLRPFKQLGVLH